jgi:ribosome maturation factor RimP
MERLRTLAQGAAALFGLELFDLESRLAGRRWWFRVTLDRLDGAVTIEDCEKVSRHLSAQLDVEDVIPHAYELEVSSPGVERPLRELKDYDRFKGCKARLILGGGGPGAGQVLEGDLAGTEGEEILLKTGDETRRVAVDRIKKAHLVFQFP